MPKSNRNKHKSIIKTCNQKECEVVSYNERSKILDVKFDKYGIRIHGVENFAGKVAVVQYKGKIGNPDFEYWLLRQ